MEDFDAAYAYEAMARAHALQGHVENSRQYHGLAARAGQAISDAEDREIFMADFKRGRGMAQPERAASPRAVLDPSCLSATKRCEGSQGTRRRPAALLWMGWLEAITHGACSLTRTPRSSGRRRRGSPAYET
jgi:hypothetical protein